MPTVNLTPGLHYRTTLETSAGAPACIDARAFALALPHGSGFDTDWYVQVHKNGNVTALTKFHTHGEHGYTGWTPVYVRVYRESRDILNPLRGPMAGKVQVLARRGDIRWSVHASNRDGFRDYLCDLFTDVVRPFVTHRNETVDAATDATEAR